MCERDLELMLIGALAADRSLEVSQEWFRDELKQLVNDLQAKRRSKGTTTWLENRGVLVNGSMVGDLIGTVKRRHDERGEFSLQSEVLRLRQEIERLRK